MQSSIEREAGVNFPSHNIVEGQGMGATISLGEDKTFERVKAQLKARLGSDVYSSWFGRMKLAEASKGVARLSVPTAFLRSWINGHYLDLINELWKHEEPDVLKIEIVVRSATRHGRVVPEQEQPLARKAPRPAQTALGSGTLTSQRREGQLSLPGLCSHRTRERKRAWPGVRRLPKTRRQSCRHASLPRAIPPCG